MGQFLSTREVASHFGTTPENVAAWCRHGLIDHLPRAHRQPWRIPRAEIDRIEQDGVPPSRRSLERQ